VLVRLPLDELDSVVDQVGVEVIDLLLAELDIVEPRSDLVVVQDSLLEPFLNKLWSSSTSGSEISTVSIDLRFLVLVGLGGLDLLRHVKGRRRRLPRLTPARGGC